MVTNSCLSILLFNQGDMHSTEAKGNEMTIFKDTIANSLWATGNKAEAAREYVIAYFAHYKRPCTIVSVGRSVGLNEYYLVTFRNLENDSPFGEEIFDVWFEETIDAVYGEY